MNQSEANRLQILKNESVLDQGLTYHDLLLIAKYDKKFRHVISEIHNNECLCEDAEQAVLENKLEIENVVNNTKKVNDHLRTELEEQLRVIRLLEKYSELQKWLNRKDENSTEGELLLSWCAFVSDLDNVLLLWDYLESFCISEERALNKNDSIILEASINQHNLCYKNSKVKLLYLVAGSNYDYEKHKRVLTPQGNTVEKCLMPGISNVDGCVVRKPLICTE